MIDITESIGAEERDALLAHWDRVAGEPEFRRALRRDPRFAIEQRLGVRVPEDVEIGVDPEDPRIVRMARRKRPGKRSGEGLA